MKLARLFFLTFVFFIPSQLALHFWPDFSLIFGIRVDYLAPTIYFSEILMLLSLVFWILIKKPTQVNRLALLFLFFIVLNILFSISIEVSLFKWLKFIELVVFAWFVFQNKTWMKNNLHKPLMLSTIVVSILSLLQLVLQRSVGGIWYWIGERSFTTNTIGISKFNFLGQEILRPYASFPHPNVLGAFGIFCFLVLKGNIRWACLLLVLLSFSQASWIAMLIILLAQNVHKHTLRQLAKLLMLFSFLVPLLFHLLPTHQFDVLSRQVLQQKALAIIVSRPSFGVGLGNFVVSNAGHDVFTTIGTIDGRLRFQPVHNVFLLIASEWGVAGVVIVSHFLLWYIKNANRFGLLFITLFFVTASVDHYWLTLWQAQVMLGLGIALGFGRMVTHKTQAK